MIIKLSICILHLYNLALTKLFEYIQYINHLVKELYLPVVDKPSVDKIHGRMRTLPYLAIMSQNFI